MSCSVEELEHQLTSLRGTRDDFVRMREEELRGGFRSESGGGEKGRVRWLTQQIEDLEERIEDKREELRERGGSEVVAVA